MANYGRGWGDGYGGQSAEAVDDYQGQQEIEMDRIKNARAQREPDRRGMTQAQYEHSLVIERVIIALHDLGSRSGATAKGVRSQLKEEGFTPAEIAEAVKKMTSHNLEPNDG